MVLRVEQETALPVLATGQRAADVEALLLNGLGLRADHTAAVLALAAGGAPGSGAQALVGLAVVQLLQAGLPLRQGDRVAATAAAANDGGGGGGDGDGGDGRMFPKTDAVATTVANCALAAAAVLAELQRRVTLGGGGGGGGDADETLTAQLARASPAYQQALAFFAACTTLHFERTDPREATRKHLKAGTGEAALEFAAALAAVADDTAGLLRALLRLPAPPDTAAAAGGAAAAVAPAAVAAVAAAVAAEQWSCRELLDTVLLVVMAKHCATGQEEQEEQKKHKEQEEQEEQKEQEEQEPGGAGQPFTAAQLHDLLEALGPLGGDGGGGGGDGGGGDGGGNGFAGRVAATYNPWRG